MVREGGTPKAGIDLGRDRTAADCFTTLEDERFQSRLSKVERSNEAIVAAADDDNAIRIRRQGATSCRTGCA